MGEVILILGAVAVVTCGVGLLVRNHWLTAAAVIALTFPLWFLVSPLGLLLGPGMMILCWGGALAGAAVAEALLQRRARRERSGMAKHRPVEKPE
jgi:hypothetical protein